MTPLAKRAEHWIKKAESKRKPSPRKPTKDAKKDLGTTNVACANFPKCKRAAFRHVYGKWYCAKCPTKPAKKLIRMKPWKAWARVDDDGSSGRIYRGRDFAEYFRLPRERIARVLVTELGTRPDDERVEEIRELCKQWKITYRHPDARAVGQTVNECANQILDIIGRSEKCRG